MPSLLHWTDDLRYPSIASGTGRMEALLDRARELHALQINAFRVEEHSTFDRLLYKNRNQHRRGPYFQRLEHVRRVVRKVRNHSAWNFVRAVTAVPIDDSKKKPTGRQRKWKKPAVTAELAADFERLADMMEDLVENIIPKAALRVTLELVCREHFLPFAVSVLAILSRIFTVERSLLRKMQGIVVDIRIFTVVPTKARVRHAANPAMEPEDVGEVIEVEECNDAESEGPVQQQEPLPGGSKAGRKMVNRFCAPAPSRSTVGSADLESDGNVDVPKKQAPSSSQKSGEDASKLAGSLYDLMAEEDSELASLAKAQVAANIRIKAAEAPSRIRSTSPEQRQDGKNLIAPPPNNAQPESEYSEDLDDIFAGMSD